MIYSSVSVQFSRASKYYDEVASLQLFVARRLLNLLPVDVDILNVLELGCGTGSLTCELLGRFKQANIHAIDVSRGMIERLSQKKIDMCGADTRLSLEICDARECEFAKTYDLITSSSALHWMQPLSDLFRRLRSACRPDGSLCFALMIEGTFRELQYVRKCVVPNKSWLWPFPNLNEIIKDLGNNGFCVQKTEVETFKCRFPSVTEFFQVLRKLGVNGRVSHYKIADNQGAMNADMLLNRGEIKKLTNAYEEYCREQDGCVFATYEVCFLSARILDGCNV